MRSRLLALLAALALVVTAGFVVGCGDDDDDGDGGSGGGDDLGLITEGELLVGTDTPFPPFEIGQPPDISGYEVYSALRRAQPSAHVILMTGFGYDSTHSIVKARHDGLRYVLYKPFRVDQLLTALQNAPPAGNGNAKK